MHSFYRKEQQIQLTRINVKEWLELKPKDKNAVLIVDEASFASQFTGESENFLERFKALKNKPPGFLWKGKYYSLSDKHKVIFAFNPASYGCRAKHDWIPQ